MWVVASVGYVNTINGLRESESTELSDKLLNLYNGQLKQALSIGMFQAAVNFFFFFFFVLWVL